MKDELQDKVAAILEEYMAGGLSGELEARIQGWIADGCSEDEKAAVLEELWGWIVSYNPKPSANAYQMYLEITESLGIPVSALPFPPHSEPLRRMARKATSVAGAFFSFISGVVRRQKNYK